MRLKIIPLKTTSNYKILRILFAFFTSFSWLLSGHAQDCNIDSEIIITNLTQGIPMDSLGCEGGDTLEICFKVNNYLPTSLDDENFFHSLIPDFGECIIPINTTPEGEPGIYTLPFSNNMGTPGNWLWFPDGVVLYNDIPNGSLPPFSNIGGGWSYVNSWGCFGQQFEPDPNQSRGDQDSNFGTQWEVCFLAEALCTQTGDPIACEISFKTYSEGETGCGYGVQCVNDEPWTFNFELICCEQPIITVLETEYTICSGDLFELPLTSNMDPETTYEWIVNPGIYGATAGEGNVISDVLFNPECNPVTETYFITPTCAFGCVGEVFVVTVTILPEFEMSLGPDRTICEWDLVTIVPQITCSGDYTYQWSTGETTETITVGPGFYTLTVFDAYGCVIQTDDVFVFGESNFIFANILAPNGTEVCEGESITLIADATPTFLGPFDYYWSTGESGPSISPTSSGTYNVTIFSWNNCTIEGYASIDVTFFENPEVELFADATTLCPGQTISINAESTTGSYGGCVWNDGSTEPQLIVSPGIGVTTYSVVVTDGNGCTGEGSIEITVEEDLISPYIDCIVTETSIEFSWYPIPGATSYIVNGQEQSGTSLLFDGLSPNETVDITVEAINGGNCNNSFAESSCTTSNCPTLNLQITPVDLFCQEDITIELQASEPGGQWYGPGITDPVFGLFNPLFANPGNNTIIYVISNNTCEYTTTTEIEVEEALTEVTITCNSTVDAVSFSWESIPNASGYLVNGTFQDATSFMVNNLLPNQGANITVEAISNGICPNTSAQAYCQTEDCAPVSLAINSVATVCQDGTSIQLQANEQDVTWSGPGVTDALSGNFDPSSALVGLNTITCTLIDGACVYTTSTEIEVEASLATPVINCNSTVDEVSFSWTPVDGATSYLVNGIEQNGTTYQANNLQPNQEVFISVVAVNNGACENSIAETSCVAQDCEVVSLAINPVSNLCQDGGSIQLQATEQNVIWSGSGITNELTGDFDPASANVGMNTVVCTWTNGACEYTTSLEIEVEAALATPIINCNSTVDEVSFSWSEVQGATSYLVNGVEQNGTTYQANNLQPNQEISITVVAVNNGVCGNSMAESSCVAQDCAVVNLAISPVSSLCQADGNIQLQASEQNVIWSGAGITNETTGDFDPASANVGMNTVVCTWTDGACEYTTSLEIEVEAVLAAPVISCNSTVDEVSFSWAEIQGATSYIVNGIEQNGTTYQANNLQPNQEVSITVVAVNNGVCGNSMAESSCVAQDCAVVNLAISPVSSLCQADGNIQLQASEQNVIWSGAGITNETTGDFDPASANVGMNTVVCSWTNGACEYTTSLEIEVEAALATPVINCNSTVDEVSFSWAEVQGATSYLVNGIEQNGTTYQANNLQPNQEVSITVVAVNNGVCGNSTAESSCVAQDCAVVNLAISPVSSLCQADGSIQLQATEQNVIWSGSGITNELSGDFDPASANVGMNTVICTWTDGACEYATSLEIEVEAALATPVISCNSTVDEVSFSWTPVDGATSYLVNGIEQNGTTYQANNLQPNQEVSISVVAVNNGVCGNSMSEASCVAQDCAVVNLAISPVSSLCQADGSIQLQATEQNVIWSGSGIINELSGDFDPASANVGMNTVVCTWTDGACEYTTSLEIEVEAALATPVISCNSTVDEVSFSWAPVDGATSYLVNGIEQNGTTYQANNLQPNQEVAISVVAVNNGICGNTMAESTCYATDCSVVNMLIAPVADICGNELPNGLIELEVQVLGTNTAGLWSGAGIVDPVNGFFDPSTAGLQNGENEIVYTIEDGFCEFSESASINIYEALQTEVIQIGALDCSETPPILVSPEQTDVEYIWTTPSGNQLNETQIEALEEGQYSLLIVSSLSGCTATESISLVSDLSTPFVELVNPDGMLTCANEEVVLNAANSSQGSDFNYEWEGPAGLIPNGVDPAELPIDQEGIYTLVVTDLINNCSSFASISVLQNTTAPIVEAGESLEFGCNDEQLALSGFASLDADVLIWKDETGATLSSDLLLDNNISTNVFTPGVYTLEAMNSETGCVGIDQVVITVDEDVPSAIVTMVEPASCHDEQDAFIEIMQTEGGSAPYTYAFGEQSFSDNILYPYLSAGLHQLTVKDADGCTLETEILVPETQPVILDIGSDMDLTLGESEVIHLQTNISMTEIDTIIWTSSETIECMDDDCMEIKLTPKYSTEVHAILVKESGCIGEASIRLTLDKPRDVYIPNAFSPNNDDNNDIFFLQGKSEVVKVNRLLIFNRWGEVVFDAADFELNDPNKGWDGYLNGKELNPGVFIYQAEVEFIDGEVVLMKGDVTLMK